MQLFDSVIYHFGLLAVNMFLVSLQLKYYYWTSNKLENNMWKISYINWLDILQGILIKIINFNSDSKTSYYNMYVLSSYGLFLNNNDFILLNVPCKYLVKKK